MPGLVAHRILDYLDYRSRWAYWNACPCMRHAVLSRMQYTDDRLKYMFFTLWGEDFHREQWFNDFHRDEAILMHMDAHERLRHYGNSEEGVPAYHLSPAA